MLLGELPVDVRSFPFEEKTPLFCILDNTVCIFIFLDFNKDKKDGKENKNPKDEENLD